jgi:hypothetical protein
MHCQPTRPQRLLTAHPLVVLPHDPVDPRSLWIKQECTAFSHRLADHAVQQPVLRVASEKRQHMTACIPMQIAENGGFATGYVRRAPQQSGSRHSDSIVFFVIHGKWKTVNIHRLMTGACKPL